MGFGRFIWKFGLGGWAVDNVKNVVKERSIIEGTKRTIQEDLYEDNPLTSTIYKSGKYEGKKEGYIEASDVYEQKLLEQADEFLNQKKNFENAQKEYQQLLNDYDEAITELSNKLERSEQENETLQQLLLKERLLKNLK